MNESPWQRLDFELAVEPALEIRAEPDGRGGWHIRSERATGSTGPMLMGWLVSDQPYAVRVNSDA
jgi:hypothetical protein